MKVVQLGPYPPPHGGVQTNLVAIHRLLLERQIPCAVINITRHRKTEGDGIYYPKTAFQLVKRLLKLRYDVIHLHLGGDLTPRLLALSFVCCLMPASRTVLTFHSGGYPSSPAGRTARPTSLRGFVFRRFDRIIAVNQQIVDFFQRLGIAGDRIRLIAPHSVAGHIPDSSAWPESLQQFFQIHSPVLISVGLLEPEYDLPLQIEVARLVRDQFPNAGLVMIGSGSLEEELRKQIRAKPYCEHVLLCGDVPHPATLMAISKADVMLRTTLYDGDAVSVREALHFGTPVIASDNGMRPPGVQLIPSRNLGALFSAIQAVLASSRNRRRAVGVEEENLEAVLEVYRSLWEQ